MSDPRQELFATKTEGVEKQAAKGGAATGLSSLMRVIITGGSTLFLVRLLTPADFGAEGMIVAMTGMFDLLKDLGLSTATVQRDQVDHAQVNALFWINVGIGAVLTLGVAASAPFIGAYYGRPVLVPLTLALSLRSFLGALPLQHEALLRRSLRFAPVAWIASSSACFASVCAVILAFSGFGVWSLVLQQLIQLVTRVILIWIVSPWRPTRPVRANVGAILRFGGHLSAFQVMTFIEKNADNVLVGRYAGPRDLGYYANGYSVMRVPLDEVNRPLSSVIISSMARLSSDAARYRAFYFGVVRGLTVVMIPLAPLAALAAPWFVPTIFGSQWTPGVRIFQWLVVGVLAKPLMDTMNWLLITQGRSGDLMRWGVVSSGLAIASFVVGIGWGALGVAVAYTLLELFIRMPLYLWWVGRKGPVSTKDLLVCALPAWITAGVTTLTYLAADHLLLLIRLSLNTRTIVALLSAAAVAVLALRLSPWGHEVRQDVAAVFEALRRRKATPKA